ncbi:MAG: AsmA family protein, partial [Bacteroidales bacterium]|nr:AsmA family protein [Bacteroidales bacterium]
MSSFPIKRITKIALISVGGLLTAVLLAAGIALSVLLSPKRLTPLVNHVASGSLRAEVQIRKVDFTLSTFPHIGLELKDGVVVSHALRDSAFLPEDTLCLFHRCVVGLNVRAYTRHKKLSLATAALDSVDARLFTDTAGRSNYQVFITDTLAEATSSWPFLSVEVKRFRIGHADVRFVDRCTGTEARIGDLVVTGAGQCDTVGLQASLHFEVADIGLTRANQKIIKGIPFKGNLQTAYNYQERKGTLLNAGLRVKRLELGLQGDFSMDTTGTLGLDMDVDLRTVSLQELLDMVPSNYLKTQDVKADGQLNMHGRLYGRYGEGQMPEMDLRLNLENGRAHYEGMPYPIDTLLVRLNAHLAPGQKKPSYVNIEDLAVVAKDLDVVAACRVDRLFTDPSVDFKLSTQVDLAVLPQIFPLRGGLAMGGVV